MSEQVEIKLEESETKGRFFAVLPDDGAAEMTFSKVGDGMMIIDHTAVANSVRGTGLGKCLLEQGVAYARKTGRKIVPLCPYAASQFSKHLQWGDVLS